MDPQGTAGQTLLNPGLLAHAARRGLLGEHDDGPQLHGPQVAPGLLAMAARSALRGPRLVPGVLALAARRAAPRARRAAARIERAACMPDASGNLKS